MILFTSMILLSCGSRSSIRVDNNADDTYTSISVKSDSNSVIIDVKPSTNF